MRTMLLTQRWVVIDDVAVSSPPISGYDVFNEGKTQSFFESQQATMALCTYFEAFDNKTEDISENQLREYFDKLLQVSKTK